MPTAQALRRLVYQLRDRGLPIEPFWRRDGGLAFDLLSSYTTGEKVLIGHADGVITIDLVKSLDAYRETLRVALGEPYRTMLGHFRHEVGHGALRKEGPLHRYRPPGSLLPTRIRRHPLALRA